MSLATPPEAEISDCFRSRRNRDNPSLSNMAAPFINIELKLYITQYIANSTCFCDVFGRSDCIGQQLHMLCYMAFTWFAVICCNNGGIHHAFLTCNYNIVN